MEQNRLCAWLGRTDIRASEEDPAAGIGPIAQALDSDEYDGLTLLSNYPAEETSSYYRWLSRRQPDIHIDSRMIRLTSPTEFSEIYEQALRVLKSLAGNPGEQNLTFHLSPGTPAMAATWILIASGPYPAGLIETSREKGVRKVELPFDILAEYRPRGGNKIDQQLIGISDEMLPDTPAFDEIIHGSESMKRTVMLARRIALFDVPVLLLGESGTGKELFAKAIHNASGRAGRPYISVNCGALPEGLVESELFGYVKGAFTGASGDKVGYIEAADGGTLFLDEVGELPLHVQVLLLRVLQDRSFQRVGSTRRQSSDFRLICATNRDLAGRAADGSFRKDLFHRIAVGVIKLPPLRRRGKDLDVLADHFLGEINQRFGNINGWEKKNLTVGARKLLHEYSWPGNVRELINTLTRASLWSSGTLIDRTILEDSFVRINSDSSGGPTGDRGLPAVEAPLPEDSTSGRIAAKENTGLLDQPIGGDFSIEAVIGELARHYLNRAMIQSGGSKTGAAKLLGLSNYQTLSNWLRKYGVDEVGNKPS